MHASVERFTAAAGLAVAAGLFIGAGLLTWAHVFITDQGRHQLTAQSITMPSAAALKRLPAPKAAALRPWAGRRLETGREAKAYADDFVAVHLSHLAKGRTYSQIAAKYLALTPAQRAAPLGRHLAALKKTLLAGDTLRGLLLNAYAFFTIGTIAGIAAVVGYVVAGVLFLLALLGLWRTGSRDTRELATTLTSSTGNDDPLRPVA